MVANHLVDEAGNVVQLRGVNRSGLEYACVQGWGFFDGPSDGASISAIASWGANAVRLPLNEDCWLGIKTPNPEYSGENYRDAVVSFVKRLHGYGLAVVLDLQWAEDRAAPATGTLGELPDAVHAPAFWSSVASTFRTDGSVIFDLYNEPHDIDWPCWRDGCTLSNGSELAGMQLLVTTVRATGAMQPIMLGGLANANDLSGWLSHMPVDPVHKLVASFHLYNFNECRTRSCWDSQLTRVASKVPIIAGEVGENDGKPALLEAFLPWADTHNVSYLGWAWNVWKDPIALISDYGGTPTAFGAGLRDHLLLRDSIHPVAESSQGGHLVVISRGHPVHASSENYPAANAASDDYSAMWRSVSYPCWVAYDLSSVPEASRRRVYSQWSNTNTYNYDVGVFSDRAYNLPGHYVIEANPGPGDTSVPTNGWVPLVAVTENTYHSGAHLLDMTGHRWLRLRATAGSPMNADQNTDCALKWDVFDASAGMPDSWIFYGDSITAEAMSPNPGHRDSKDRQVDNFAKLVNHDRPDRFPAQQDGGVGGLTLHYAVSHGLLSKWLDVYPGRYVVLGFGSNDANGDGFDARAYYDDLVLAASLVKKVGKVPIIPTLVASLTRNIQAHGAAANEKVAQLCSEDSSVLAGPDLWALFTRHPDWIGADGLHPTATGYGQIRIAWALWAVSARL